jgi:hypothetical protein
VADWVARPLLAPIDNRAEAVAQAIAVRAGAAFAVSKTINAALSLAEHVTVSANVVLVEGSVQPAALLTPVNDLVEQFARIMLAVAGSALLIELLLHIGAGYGTWVLLAVPLALFALGAAMPARFQAARVKRLAYFAILVAVLVRIALPLALVATGAISDRYLAERYQAANAGLEVLQTKTADAADAAQTAEDEGWTTMVLGSVKRAMAVIRESFGNTFQDVVTIVTVFFMETVVLPLLIVLALWRGLFLLLPRSGRGA